MSKSTISTYQLFEMVPDAEAAGCGWKAASGRTVHAARYAVSAIGSRPARVVIIAAASARKTLRFAPGPSMERSHIPLHKWVYTMYLLVTARKGISSLQLAKEIGITQKSAWFLLHRLREACGSKFEKLKGIIEIDETYVGGIEANKHKKKKLNAGRGAVGKTAVLGMRERDSGKVKAKPIVIPIKKPFTARFTRTSRFARPCIPTSSPATVASPGCSSITRRSITVLASSRGAT